MDNFLACLLKHRIYLNHRGICWQSTSYVRFSTDTFSRNSSLCDSKCYRCDSSAGRYRATCRTRWRTNWKHSPNANFSRRPSTMNSMAGQQRLQISEFQFDKFPTPPSFMHCKIRFKTQVCSCSDFPSDAMLWIPEVEMVDSVDEFRDQLQVRVSRILNCSTRELLPLWTRSSKITTSRKRSVWRNRKLRKRIGSFEEDRSLTWFTSTSELLVLMMQFLTMPIYSLSLFATTTFRNPTRDGMKFYCLWPRSRLMIFWKVCTNWEYVSLINSKRYSNCTTWNFIRRFRGLMIRSWKRWWKEEKIRIFDYEIFDARIEKIETGALVTSRRRLGGIEKRKRNLLSVEKQKGSVREETNAVSGMTVMSVEDRHQKPLHPLSHQHKEVEVRREKDPQRQKPVWEVQPTACKKLLKGACTRLPCDYWHPPAECPFYKWETGCKFGEECSFPHWKVEEQPNKRPKKGGDKSAVAILKSVRQLGCVSQDAEPPESVTISRKGTKVSGPIRRVRFTRAALRQANIRDNKGPSLGKNQVKSSHQRDLRKRPQDKSDAPAETRGNLPRTSLISQKRKESYILFAFRWVGFAGRIHKKNGGKRFCGGLRSKHAYGQQDRPWLCRIGNRKDLKKSDDGGNSQRRGANKRRSNFVCQGIGFIRDSNASRRYTGSSFTRKNSAKITGIITIGPVVRYHISSKIAERSIATQRTTYPSLSLVYRQVLQPHLCASSQETVTPTEHPASTRSESMSEDVQGNLSHGPPETENPQKMTTTRKYEGTCRMICQKFRHGLVDGCVPVHWDASSSSHELPSEPRAKVVSGKHSGYTHFPKDRHCDVCLKTKITSASCRKCTSTVVPRAESVGDFITEDHKVLSEGCESRNNHRYAVVVQDLGTQWIQSYPCKRKNFSGNAEELAKVLGADEETKSHLHWQFFRIWQSLWRPFLESLYVNTS